MVDPMNVTDYNRNDFDLQEFAIFSICVAGKTAKTIAPRVSKMLKVMTYYFPSLILPMDLIPLFNGPRVANWLKWVGIGCYNHRSRSLLRISRMVRAGTLNLRTCSVSDLEQIPYIGPKTARFFLLHSRPNMRVAALDTHILKHLAKHGYNVPTGTPSKGAKYNQLEQNFIGLADKAGMSPADYDLMVWRHYSAGVPLTAE